MRLFITALLLSMSACSTTTDILSGASHACGQIHAEGYFTDTQGEIVIVKAPADWTPEQVLAFCASGN
jgi:hypothetical protein